MMRIFDIAAKDLLQLVRDRNTFLFFLIMPLAFTILFGYAFGGGGANDSRLPVGFLDQEQSTLSRQLEALLEDSAVIRLVKSGWRSPDEMQAAVADDEIAAGIIIPGGYSHAMQRGNDARLIFFTKNSGSSMTTVESEILTAVIHLESAVRTAIILEDTVGARAPYDYTVAEMLSAWQDPPIKIIDRTSTVINKVDNRMASLAHTSPGMMLQFAVAGLLVCAQVIVSERKSRALQRLLTTDTLRLHILTGHYLAIFTLIFLQFAVLITFGQLVLKLNYLREPLAILLVATSAAMCIGALGLLIGVVAKNEEQAIVLSLVPMFILAGLGGAMTPLEVTSKTFQTIGHISPIAWGMDGFKNIINRGLGLDSVLLPVVALIGYALLFFLIAAWRFNRLQEK